MRRAIIEVGTNSVKIIAGENEAGTAKILFDINAITALGEGLSETGEISDSAAERTAETVERFATFARRHGAKDVSCVGTMALRAAKNASRFLELVRNRASVEVRVLAGEEEAALSGRAMLFAFSAANRGKVLMFDAGGGSTEFIAAEDGEIAKVFSVKAGAVTLTEKVFNAPKNDAKIVNDAVEELIGLFREAGVEKGAKTLIGSGGNLTAIACVAAGIDKFDPAVIHGFCLSAEEVARQAALYASCSPEERRGIKGLPPKRADIILAGACIILAAMDASGVKELTVSDRGLRHALLFEALKAKE